MSDICYPRWGRGTPREFYSGGQIIEAKTREMDADNYPAGRSMIDTGCRKCARCLDCPFLINRCPSFVGDKQAFPCMALWKRNYIK